METGQWGTRSPRYFMDEDIEPRVTAFMVTSLFYDSRLPITPPVYQLLTYLVIHKRTASSSTLRLKILTLQY